jgi:hypothetical protein
LFIVALPPLPEFPNAEKEWLDPHGVESATCTMSDNKVQFRESILIEGLDRLVLPDKVSKHRFAFSAILPVHARKVRHANDADHHPLPDGASICINPFVSHEYCAIQFV